MKVEEHSFSQELGNEIPSMEGYFSEMIHVIGNVFKYRPFDDIALQKGAIDHGQAQITNLKRLKNLLNRCYGDPRWVRAQTLRTDRLGPAGIANLIAYGRQFDPERPVQFITNSIYSLDAFVSGWARNTLRHSELVRQAGNALIMELEDGVKPFMDHAESMSSYVKTAVEEALEAQAAAQRREDEIRKVFEDMRSVNSTTASRPNPYATPGQSGPARPNPYATSRMLGGRGMKEVLDSDGDVDTDAVWHNFSLTDTFKAIVDRHFAKISRDGTLRGASGTAFWNGISSEQPTFGGTVFRPRQGTIVRVPIKVDSLRPLTEHEIVEFVGILKRLIDSRGFDLWKATLDRGQRGGLFFSSRSVAYALAVKYKPELKEHLDSTYLMAEWRRGSIMERNLEALVVGMINWMSRSFVNGQRL